MSTVPNPATSNFKGLRDEIKKLQEEGLKLEAQYHASHAALYALLEHAFDILTRAALEDQVEEVVALCNKWAKDHNHKFKESSDAELRLVTAVFAGAAKQRLNNYANVLRAARGREEDGKSFADWIRSKGGVQEISYSVADPIDPEKKRAADAKLIADVAAITGQVLPVKASQEIPRGMPFVMFGFVRDDGTIITLSTTVDLEVIRPFAVKAVKKDKATKKTKAAEKKQPAPAKPADKQAQEKPATTFDKFFSEGDEGRAPVTVNTKKVA